MNDKKTSKYIGKQIQEARLSSKITQEKLAESCGVSTKYISAIETGKSSGSIQLLLNICNTLKISPNFVFGTLLHGVKETIPLEDELLITYLKLNEDNKNFVKDTVNHLYKMQRKR